MFVHSNSLTEIDLSRVDFLVFSLSDYDCQKICKCLYGVWINVPLAVAMAQNKTRPADEQVPVSAMNSVFEQLECPEYAEGFDEIVLVNGVSLG